MWHYKQLEDLSPLELFYILKLRVDTFVVEQKCDYPEIDDDDLTALHVYMKEADEIKAYARIYEKNNVIYIGRIIANPKYRGKGLGKQLLETCIAYIEARYPNKKIALHAQAHLEGFYGQFGFIRQSDIAFEDFIPHIEMERA